MEKYEKLFKGLEMCAKPGCGPECPYYGEIRGGTSCRVWLLKDAAAALTLETGNKSEVDLLLAAYKALINERDVMAERLKLAEGSVTYWHGRAEALSQIIINKLDMFPDAPKCANGEATDDV